MVNTRRGKPQMSKAQKEAMAEGRTMSRSVARYLEALAEVSPRRGRRRTPESIERRLKTINEQLPTASPITKLALVQERLDLQNELDSIHNRPDLAAHEKEFIANAKAYGERKGITYAAWRELGVDPEVLSRAGIRR